MSTAMQIFKEAIRKDKAILIHLTDAQTFGRCIPVHLSFLDDKSYPSIKETAHHSKEEVCIEVDNGANPSQAWLVDDPSVVVNGVNFSEEGSEMLFWGDKPVYAFLDSKPEIRYDDIPQWWM